MNLPVQVPTSRTRERPAGDEEAGQELVLGEFSSVPSLSLSEARLLINAVMDHRRKTRGGKVEETESVSPRRRQDRFSSLGHLANGSVCTG